MSNTLRNMGLAALLAVSASAFMSSQASALSMADCSAKFRAAKAEAKAAGTALPIWSDFRKAQCGTDAAPAVAAAPAAPVKAAKVAVPTVPVTTAKVAAPAATAATPPATPSGSFMKDCSAAWKAMKASNTVPAGMAWKDFVAAKCVVAGAPAAAAPATPAVATTPEKKPGILGSMFGKKASVAPPEPSDTPDNTPVATVDKNGKALTPGQIAAHQRQKTCGEQWRALKAANKIPAEIMGLDARHRWPQYWSLCNKQLKAVGK